jgi:2-methylcitrate dehydratase PrpD
MKNGGVVTVSMDYPRGSMRNPLTDRELLDLFKKWTSSALSLERAEDIAEKVLSLETIDDIVQVTSMLRLKQDNHPLA